MLSACELIAGIEEKTLVTGPAGGGGAAPNSDGGMAGGGGTGLCTEKPAPPPAFTREAGDPLCAAGIVNGGGCDTAQCITADKNSNPCHCGVCDRACGGPYCVGGVCEVHDIISFGTPLPIASRLATNGLSLFISSFPVDDSGGAVYSVPLSGDFPVEPVLLLTHPSPVGAVAADCENLYFAEHDPGGVSNVRLMMAPLHCPSEVVEIEQGTSQVTDILADGTNVYWIFGGESGKTGPNGEIWVRYGATGKAEKVVSGLNSPMSLAGDDAYVYFNERATTNPGVDGQIQRFAKPKEAGGTVSPEVIVATAGDPRGIAVDEAHLYWFDGNQMNINGKFEVRIQRAPKGLPQQTGGLDVRATIAGSALATQIAVDDKFLYWTDAEGFRRKPKDVANLGMEVKLFGATSPVSYSPSFFVADRSRLYVTHADTTASRIYWVAK